MWSPEVLQQKNQAARNQNAAAGSGFVANLDELEELEQPDQSLPPDDDFNFNGQEININRSVQ